VLPSIAHVIQKRIPIWVDTGVRTCTDVLKALCLGATGVLIGRPPLYALACDGANGLSHMLDCLQYDLKADMMSLGVSNLSELGIHHVYPPDRQRILASIDAHFIKIPET
jgi:(S)-mandelate dehydrogenase